MLSPEEFRDEYPPGELEPQLPERPITSLRDIQYLYGRLYTLATAGGGEYADYLTPDQARDLINTQESLISVRVDLSGEELRLDPENPVTVTSYSEDHVEAVAHCKFAAARGIDHSVTHRSGRDSSTEKLARYAKERLTRWATDDVVQSVADEHDQGDVIHALAELGQDEEALNTIETEVEAQLGGTTTALLTVQVKLDEADGYQWPGEIDVFMEAMKRRKLDKLVSKGQATESAGMATGLLSGGETRTVGTAEDPLNYYLSKQMETFPGMDPDEAWRSHPVSEDAAVTLMNAETFVDACTYRTFGATVYYLPYFLGEVTVDDAYQLYGYLHAASQDSEDDEQSQLTPVTTAYRQLRSEGKEPAPHLRFYVAVVMKHQMSRFDVFGETMNGSVMYPVEVADAHNDVLESWVFQRVREGGPTPPMPSHENWDLLEPKEFLNVVATGVYFLYTFPEGDDDDGAAADDPRIQALVSVLGGEPIPVETLLDAYVTRITDEENALATDDGNQRFPDFLVASQFAQLCALARADVDREQGMLDTDEPAMEPIAQPTTYASTMHELDKTVVADGGEPSSRDKLQQFIDQTPALQNDQRRGAFLLGAVVGQVTSYQEGQGRSTTLVDQYPVKSITKNRIKKATWETLDKVGTYTREDKRSSGATWSGTKWDYLVEPLREAIPHADPDAVSENGDPDWTLDTDDLRFYYALGVTYGMNDWYRSDDQSADSE